MNTTTLIPGDVILTDSSGESHVVPDIAFAVQGIQPLRELALVGVQRLHRESDCREVLRHWKNDCKIG